MSDTRNTGYWGYGLVAIVLLVILTAAILAPDYLNYRYKVMQLETKHSASVQPPQHAPSATTLPQINDAQESAAGGEAREESAEIKALSTADIFETYGKLITMLLAFVSAVGVLVGYFIKTSIRDLIEDARSDNEREVAIFKSDKERILNEIKDTKTHIEEVSKKTLEIQKEYEQKLKEAKSLLDALEVAAQSYSVAGQTPKDDPAVTAAKVDAEL